MAAKHRELPSWMNEKKSGDCSLKNPKPKKIKKTIPRATVYLMNEWELVQSALIFGDPAPEKVCKQEASLKERRQEAAISPPEPNTHVEDVKRPHVSHEAHLDTSEQETLCYSTDRQDCARKNELCVAATLTDRTTNTELDAKKHTSANKEPCLTSPPPHDATDAMGDDDALKLVREIFFT